MSFTLYNYVLSGNCYKIRLFSSFLGVEYETVAVDFHPGQAHKAEPLLQLNPAGTLPILVVDQTVYTETQAMLVWLASRFDNSAQWFPVHAPDKLAQTAQWLAFSSRLTASVGELRLHSMINKDIDVDTVSHRSIEALRELESQLSEQRLRGYSWLVGDQPTIADVACFPYTALSPDAGIEHDDYPQIRRWIHSVKSLDGFITMPGIYELHERGGEQH